MTDLETLQHHLRGYGRALLGYSGGVDSALLAVVARRALGPDRFLAVVGRSASYPESQWRSAVDLARRYDVPLLEVDTGELADPRYLGNPTNRCYFCKSELWTRLAEVARERGFDTIMDGTNADDLGEHRPGAQGGGRASGALAAGGARVEQGGRTGGVARPRAADLGRALRAVPVEPRDLRARDHAGPPSPGRGRGGISPRARRRR